MRLTVDLLSSRETHVHPPPRGVVGVRVELDSRGESGANDAVGAIKIDAYITPTLNLHLQASPL